MIDAGILEPLLQRPDLPLLVARLQQTLAEEQAAREVFRRELTPSIKAEFILGKTIMHSPAKAKHLRATKRLVRMLDAHVERYGLGEVFSEKALICLTRNDYEPDVVFFGKQKSDLFTADQLEFPAPDFVIEVLSDSTESRDRGIKMVDYADHAVAEYWIVDCDRELVEQYFLGEDGLYRMVEKSAQVTIRSTVISGFEIPVAAIFDAVALQAWFDV